VDGVSAGIFSSSNQKIERRGFEAGGVYRVLNEIKQVKTHLRLKKESGQLPLSSSPRH